MRALAVSQAAVTDPVAVAAAFKAECLLDKTIDPVACSTVALEVEGSPFGNLGKRPFAVCKALGRCADVLDATCVLRPNTTAAEVTITAANADLCTKDSSPYTAASQLPSVGSHIFVGDDGECAGCLKAVCQQQQLVYRSSGVLSAQFTPTAAAALCCSLHSNQPPQPPPVISSPVLSANPNLPVSIMSAGADAPNVTAIGADTCVADTDCTDATCSFATAQFYCKCAANGTEFCTRLGKCKASATCANCAKCVVAVGAFVRGQQLLTTAGAVADNWKAQGAAIVAAIDVTGADVDVAAVEEAIRLSPGGNIGKRAGSLCAQMQCE
jgi:hypothetical protein